MKRINKAIIYVVIFLIIIIFIKIIISKNYNKVENINSKEYLNIKEENVSFGEKTNEMKNKDGISFQFSNFKGEFTILEITAIENTKVEIRDESIISKGNLYIVVLDSKYNSVYIHESINKSIFSVDLPKADKYFIRLIGKNSFGNLNLKVTPNTNITLTHKDIFDQ